MARAIERVLFLMRGLPGSGKSTLASELAGETGAIFSTDNYFMDNGEYHFDPSKIKQAHEWNQRQVLSAMDRGVSLIIVDNTNLAEWERKPYKTLARLHSYEVQVVHPTTDWAWNVDECFERNTHGVPRETIKAMLKRASEDKEFSVPRKVLEVEKD